MIALYRAHHIGPRAPCESTLHHKPPCPCATPGKVLLTPPLSPLETSPVTHRAHPCSVTRGVTFSASLLEIVRLDVAGCGEGEAGMAMNKGEGRCATTLVVFFGVFWNSKRWRFNMDCRRRSPAVLPDSNRSKPFHRPRPYRLPPRPRSCSSAYLTHLRSSTVQKALRWTK